MKTGIVAIAVLSLGITASANEPLWTEAERTEKRDVVIDGEVLSVDKLHGINETEDLYVAKVKVLKTYKSHCDLPLTISIHFEFSKTGKNARCPSYVELKKGDKGKFFITECGPDFKRRLKLEEAKEVLFLVMGSDVMKKESTPNRAMDSDQE